MAGDPAATGVGSMVSEPTPQPAATAERRASSEARTFPEGFVWGVSTSAPQIEGAAHEDGRRDSIWDVFARHHHHVADGSTSEVAADHYHRYREDIGLMRDLGAAVYRFSIAWPRVVPTGVGSVNPAGLDFYDRLVDELLAAGIEPWACLYHWDLPQSLADLGGWRWRGLVDAFEYYARVVAERLGDRVKTWLVLNEASTFTVNGYLLGTHAPGVRGMFAFMRAVHTANLVQGRAIQVLRASGCERVGSALAMNPIHPASDDEHDHLAADRIDQFAHRIFLDPVMLGEYPPAAQRLLKMADVRLGDMEAIHQPFDFIGANVYRHFHVAYDPRVPIAKAREIVHPNPEAEWTAMGWEVAPWAMTTVIAKLCSDYRVPVAITENGAAYDDVVEEDGSIHDARRTRFLARHIERLHQAVSEGAQVFGYLVWSLLDNWEWAEGYRRRFGLVHVDFDTQERRLKDSYHFFAKVIRENGLDRSWDDG